MCDPVSVGLAFKAISAAGTIKGALDSRKAQKTQKRASRQADVNAKANLKLQEEDNARRNQKQPNIAALLNSNQQSKGISSTLLTGAGGVNPNSLQLGGNTLLGQ